MHSLITINSCLIKIFNTNCKVTVRASIVIFGDSVVSSIVSFVVAKIYNDEKISGPVWPVCGYWRVAASQHVIIISHYGGPSLGYGEA